MQYVRVYLKKMYTMHRFIDNLEYESYVLILYSLSVYGVFLRYYIYVLTHLEITIYITYGLNNFQQISEERLRRFTMVQLNWIYIQTNMNNEMEYNPTPLAFALLKSWLYTFHHTYLPNTICTQRKVIIKLTRIPVRIYEYTCICIYTVSLICLSQFYC